jgi:hypothetical protein
MKGDLHVVVVVCLSYATTIEHHEPEATVSILVAVLHGDTFDPGLA